MFYNWHKLTLATEQHFFSVGWKKFLHNTCLDIFSVKVCGFWQIENLSCTTHAEGIRVGNNIICTIASYFVDMSHCITTTSTTDMLNTTEVKFKPRHEKTKQKQFQSICWQWITEDVTLRNNKERDFKFHYKFKKKYIWLFFFFKAILWSKSKNRQNSSLVLLVNSIYYTWCDNTQSLKCFHKKSEISHKLK